MKKSCGVGQRTPIGAAGDRQGVGAEIYYDEGLANDIAPESCVIVHEGSCEASVGCM